MYGTEQTAFVGVFQNQVDDPRPNCRAMKRNRSKAHSFEDRLAEEASKLTAQARLLPPGQQREQLLRKVRQINTAAHLNEWLQSPGLRSPK